MRCVNAPHQHFELMFSAALCMIYKYSYVAINKKCWVFSLMSMCSVVHSTTCMYFWWIAFIIWGCMQNHKPWLVIVRHRKGISLSQFSAELSLTFKPHLLVTVMVLISVTFSWFHSDNMWLCCVGYCWPAMDLSLCTSICTLACLERINELNWTEPILLGLGRNFNMPEKRVPGAYPKLLPTRGLQMSAEAGGGGAMWACHSSQRRPVTLQGAQAPWDYGTVQQEDHRCCREGVKVAVDQAKWSMDCTQPWSPLAGSPGRRVTHRKCPAFQ